MDDHCLKMMLVLMMTMMMVKMPLNEVYCSVYFPFSAIVLSFLFFVFSIARSCMMWQHGASAIYAHIECSIVCFFLHYSRCFFFLFAYFKYHMLQQRAEQNWTLPFCNVFVFVIIFFLLTKYIHRLCVTRIRTRIIWNCWGFSTVLQC